ncbi:MAG TPA: T9SS type A sorting domain-containing protein, partial [Ohtaekwangia sp.]|nr:T9SS type A sorting domain-containing protein [Ohtaekwangia sp.]
FHNGDISADNNVTINIEANATLTISGDLTIRNNLILNNSGKLIVTKNFIANNNASATVNGGGVMDVGNNINFGNNTDFVINGTLKAGGNVSFGNNETFNGTGSVNIVGTGCNKWTGSVPCIPGIVILPVKLLTFEAQDNGEGAVKISWSTAIEKNNDRFVIQRSTDGVTYNDITTVPGNGTTQEISYYDFVDNAPDAERLYYRLTQTDYDGTTETFSPVFVQVVLKSAPISAYPNPMTGRNLTLNLPEGKPGMVQFLDNRGMTILNKKFDGSGTVMELEFNNDLLPGIYFVNYKPERGDIQNLKIMKK